MRDWQLKWKLFYGAAMLFFISLFFPALSALKAAAPALLLVSSISLTPVRHRIQLLKKRKYLQATALFAVYMGISLLLSANKHEGLRAFDPRWPLVLFPLCLGTAYLPKAVKQAVLLGIALLTVIVMLICLGYAIPHSHFFSKPEFLYNDSLTEVLGQQSIYISLLVNIAIYILTNQVLSYKKSYNGWLVLAILFLFGMSFLLASRIMMIVLYVSVVVFVFYYVFSKRKLLEGVTLIMGLCIGVFLAYKFFPKTFNRFKELSHTGYSYQSMGRESHYNMEVTDDQWNGSNFRLAVWRCGWQLFKEAPVLGVGLGDKRDQLFEVYRQRNFKFALETKKNVHNNYLDILYSLGALGLVLFLIAWIILPLVAAGRNGDPLSVFIICTFAAAWITEVYFDRSLGGILTGFFIPFLLTDSERKKGLQNVVIEEEKEESDVVTPIS